MSVPFKETLHNLLQKLENQKSQWERILSAWNQVGENFKDYAHPALFRKGVLVIDVDDSNWLYFLNLKKEELLKNLNKVLTFPEIKEIRLRVR